ncbi:M36 family metallopeptidase [Actinoplanes sp. NPDC051851]|uniref:M36 family metallopeptidase n=1 Tax=Actinoplanes sp. NPDC051851 TaxID=3154753 RepID=UPI00341BB9B1
MRTSALAALALVPALVAVPAPAPAAPAAPTPTPVPASGDEYSLVDNRPPAVAARRALAGDADVTRWNDLGTPASLFRTTGGVLAEGPAGTPETVARAFLTDRRATFSLAADDVGDLETIAVTPVGSGAVVLLRQRFGGLPAAFEGQVAVTVKDGDVLRVSASLSPDTGAPAPAVIGADDATAIALADAGIAPDHVRESRVREVAVPMPGEDPRAAWEVVAVGDDPGHPLGYTTYVDARDGSVLVRVNLVDFDEENPTWSVFRNAPGLTGADTRELWCGTAAAGCAETAVDPVTGHAWDQTAVEGTPTRTTIGNSAQTVRYWRDGSLATSEPSATRDYTYPFTNQWNASGCDPAALTSEAAADSDAAMANLFAMHNRMHDWSYGLGFTEATWNLQYVNTSGYGEGGDAELGLAQSGAATTDVRNNANQITAPDGIPGITNMYLWQPVAGRGYAPCVDGDFDMTVIAHEYGHAISNRMIAGPEEGISSQEGGAMGESWSDLIAMEYLWESYARPSGVTPYVLGAYVSGDTQTGIRNYDMSASPLNYTDYGYNGYTEEHADGEIWSAANWDVREAMLNRYSYGDCQTLDSCPGNRRWIQLVFDSFLLQGTGEPSMVDMRDNMITADLLRFDGANADLLWNAFARRGLGAGATSDAWSADPTASFASPYGENLQLTFKPGGDASGRPVRLYIGDYEAGATPVADTDPDTDLPDTFIVTPGTYRFLAVGPGLGAKRFTQTVYGGGVTSTIAVVMPRNLASTANGAVVDGGGFSGALGDDTESTTWVWDRPVRDANIDLAGDDPTLISRVQLSAFPYQYYTPGGMFAGVRSFEIQACNAATGADCTTDEAYTTVYTSPDDAFDSGNFRPKPPDLLLKSFTIRPTLATHLRMVALTNQCTANPRYMGEKDSDPRTATDCAANSSYDAWTYVGEFQAFAS